MNETIYVLEYKNSHDTWNVLGVFSSHEIANKAIHFAIEVDINKYPNRRDRMKQDRERYCISAHEIDDITLYGVNQ